jgi:hypothetical protein
MKKKVTIHICDICGKQNNLGDKYESGEGTLHLKGSIGSSFANGGASFDNTYDLCLDCYKTVSDYIDSLNPIHRPKTNK